MELSNNQISLKILNAEEPNVLKYLPYGVTTLELMVEGDKKQAYGDIFTNNRSAGMNKTFVGYADDNKDFLVLWGAGKERGLNINWNNADKSLFLQILHQGTSADHASISLLHSSDPIRPVTTIKLVPAEQGTDLVRMVNLSVQKEDEYSILSFEGDRMPSYYPRWFPPRPRENNTIEYHDLTPPNIAIKFKSSADSQNLTKDINSDIEILLDNNKIAQITGDWHHSIPHAELFTLFGNGDYLILRFWLYWIHQNFSKRLILGGPALAEKLRNPSPDEKARLQLWRSLVIECPDNERFDFLIDTKKKKVTWVGTDFHYQESWYKIDDSEPYVRARIANDADAIEKAAVKGIKRLIDKINPPMEHRNSYNPITRLKEIIAKNVTAENVSPVTQPELDNGDIARLAEGITRKHIPYCENGKTGPGLVSSVVTS